MKVKEEIQKYSKKEDVPILLWLFERYHWESQFMFVAKCHFERYGKESYKTNRIWEPTLEGRILYESREKYSPILKGEERVGLTEDQFWNEVEQMSKEE